MPFDNTNKPARWRGHGTVTEASPTRLLYRDDSGIEVLYRRTQKFRRRTAPDPAKGQPKLQPRGEAHR